MVFSFIFNKITVLLSKSRKYYLTGQKIIVKIINIVLTKV